jgi:hypothetical protein
VGRADPSVSVGARMQTTAGRAACFTEQRFHEFMAHVALGRSDSVAAILGDPENSGCFMLRGGVGVVVVRDFPTHAEVRPDGVEGTVWTVRETLAPADRDSL